MAITKLVRAEFDRAVQEELFDIKFIDFGEGLGEGLKVFTCLCFFTKYRDM